MRQWINIIEGGQVFKTTDKKSTTQRINQTDVKTTVTWLEKLTGLHLQDNLLGSTGKTPTSGDIDLLIDQNETSKQEILKQLLAWCQSHNLDPRDYVKPSGPQIHFRAPINGNPDLGWVQVDFMFSSNPRLSQFALSGPTDSRFSGTERNIVLNSIAKSLNLKLNQNTGLMNRDTNKLVTDDPDEIARTLLSPSATREDLSSVETIMKALASDPKRDKKLQRAREHFQREGIPFFESADFYQSAEEPHFLARLRDRIVNQGMIPIFENEEFKTTRAKGIEHLEDLVFRRGSSGINEAIQFLDLLAKRAPQVASVKMDGKPAIWWGRLPDGQFVLTDTAGFNATGYDGLFTSLESLTERLQHRDLKAKNQTRIESLKPVYETLWSRLEAATPKNFRGFVSGDLLYHTRPQEHRGMMVFKPNTVTYRIPMATDLGQQIANSDVGIAIHTQASGPESPKIPVENTPFRKVPGLLIISPIRATSNVESGLGDEVAELKTMLREHGKSIDQLFHPHDLRSMQISDFPRLIMSFINSQVADCSVQDFSAEEMIPSFLMWLRDSVTPRKFINIQEYLRCPQTNEDALVAAFSCFILLHQIKMDVLSQLDQQAGGHEGWVVATPEGAVKLVDRFDFTRKNKWNNP